MSPRLQRGLLLLQQSRFDQAIDELRQHLLEDPEDWQAHAYLSLSLGAKERFDEAQLHAQQAIGLAPEESFTYYVLADVLKNRNHLQEAQGAIEAALRLDPHDADYYAVLSSLHLQQRRWKEALAAANQGLAIDPEQNGCLNLRAQAQIKLGDKAGAAATIDEALARRPDDPVTHANQGWAYLEAGNPKQAMEHFREALRQRPDLDFARAGIVEALKARNFVYRWMLGYFLWMSKLSRQVQWGLFIGLMFAQSLMRGVANANPQLAPYVWPVLYCYIGFALMTWIADPLFNLLLRLDRFGRYALSDDQRRGANWLGGCLACGLIAAGSYLATRQDSLFLLALVFGMLCLPISAIYRCSEGWPRTAMMAATGILFAIGLVMAIPVELLPRPHLVSSLIILMSNLAMSAFIIGILGSQFLANYLMSVTPRR